MHKEILKPCVIEKRTVNYQKLVSGSLAVTLCLGNLGSALAQRTQQDRQENRQDQRQQRRQDVQNMTPEQRQQYFQGRQQQFQQQAQQRWNAMTPQERQQVTQQQQQAQQRRRTQQLDDMAKVAGITDPEVLDLIKQFIQTQQTAREPLLEMARNLAKGLPSKTVTEDATATALTDFRKAIADDKDRYEKALKQLDTQIQYSTNPKLEAFLMLIGVVGSEAATVGGAPSIFQPLMTANGMGGFGGFGGGPGGGGGFGGGRGGGGGFGGGGGGQ